ncbi:NUDIX domain-containing protein [Longimicrobium sp.]|uniref:NUDIX domain-containing protein n=1 Tax=Longimicrobium sp. TaxID=2029185 RepID=UPI002E37A84F|nr:NUDIX domain-containing protein [Longimicrobium sp.]HEX6039532.1 NUDIX domain-containing protein [Longimicrobium sp.]
MSEPIDIPPDEDVPEWAVRYNAGDYPLQAVTGDAVALALENGTEWTLRALLVERGKDPFGGLDAWPGGFMDWEDADTRQAAIRELDEETGIRAPEYVEALASYSRNGRDPRQFAGTRDEKTGAWTARGARVTTAAYLMLVSEPAEPKGADDATRAHWADVYAYLPWEDVRDDARRAGTLGVRRALDGWAGRDRTRLARVRDLFDLDDWNEERTAERWALLVESALVPEGRRDRWGRSEPRDDDALFGREMAFDHREILADALGRIRGKIKYMPAALMALTGPRATLDELQAACEAIAGRPLHRSNFRRAVAPPARTEARAPRIVGKTGQRREREGKGPGVAPEIYRFLDDAVRARLDTSIRFPWLPLTASDR